ncbi:OSM3-like kinesin [Novymonas esmeraldas]|uniref:OSM3-like kinesin n=1 Tax=Novymonas esmeraldas TaxID=1808958 RepID=A0AAW0F334_9TRYP
MVCFATTDRRASRSLLTASVTPHRPSSHLLVHRVALPLSLFVSATSSTWYNVHTHTHTHTHTRTCTHTPTPPHAEGAPQRHTHTHTHVPTSRSPALRFFYLRECFTHFASLPLSLADTHILAHERVTLPFFFSEGEGADKQRHAHAERRQDRGRSACALALLCSCDSYAAAPSARRSPSSSPRPPAFPSVDSTHLRRRVSPLLSAVHPAHSRVSPPILHSFIVWRGRACCACVCVSRVTTARVSASYAPRLCLSVCLSRPPSTPIRGTVAQTPTETRRDYQRESGAARYVTFVCGLTAALLLFLSLPPSAGAAAMVKKVSGAENIRVVIRCRDILPYEAERGDKALVRLDLATNQVVVQHPVGDSDVFAFDAVYNNSFTQRDIFLQEVQPLADAVLQGYNATVFAYGQSGSGKTHTMTGKLSQRDMWGIMPQVVDYLFSEIKKLTSPTKTFKVKVSYVELYNGKSRDLLASKQVNLEIKQNMAKNFYVKGAEMPEVTSFDEAIRWFNAGTERRQTASTDLNDTSSRSHSLFTVQIENFDFENDPSSPIVMTSKINVVDLAGSEKLSKTNATGDTAKEGCNINLSLSALATVIDTIVKGAKHVPYRGSPLTMLLKDSLGGNAKTVMFANVGPSDKNLSETISTLRFALRAKQIENKPIKNMDPKDARIQDLMDQIEELKKRLGNVDLNVEDNLRQRIEELEIENSDLRGGGEKNNIELEERNRTLLAQIEEKEKEVAERQHEIRKEMERRELVESNLSNESSRLRDLRFANISFLKRVCTDEQLEQMRTRMSPDKTAKKKKRAEEDWDVKEIGVYLQGFVELYEHWRKVTYTQEDMEKYARRAMTEQQEQTQRQLNDATRAKEDVQRQRDEEAARHTAEQSATSQLKVDLHALREENVKLREKIERDQEKIKAKLAKTKEEMKSLQDQVESAKSKATEKERDADRLRRMLEEQGGGSGVAGGGSRRSFSGPSQEGAADWGSGEERATMLHELEAARHAKTILEHRIKETNVSLRRFGVCIVDPQSLESAEATTANEAQAFVLAAAEEEPVDGDVVAQLQQQIRTKQRLVELMHQHQMRLDDMVRKYELLKTGRVTANSTAAGGAAAAGSMAVPEGAALDMSGGGGIDEATANQVKELLQRKEDEVEAIRLEKDQACDKLVKKLNKSERKMRELESVLEEERTQFTEEKVEVEREMAELHGYNQQLALELENARSQAASLKAELDSAARAKESEVEYYKSQIEEANQRLDAIRNTAAEFEEQRKSYQRLQELVARTENALAAKDEDLESNRKTLQWSNRQLEKEKQKSEELEQVVRDKELELRQQEQNFRAEMAEQMNALAASNNRRLAENAAQCEERINEERMREKALQKKIKSAKATASKAAQRYDEMILENEALQSKLEELKVASMKMYLERQESQRDHDSYRPGNGIRSRGL